MLWHFALSILGHWATIIFGVVFVAVGIAKPGRLIVPDFLYSVALALGVALAGGGYLYDAGYRGALHGVEIAQLKEDLAQADETISEMNRLAAAAGERERVAAEQRQSDSEKVRAYEIELAQKHGDVDLSRAELERLRGLVEDISARASRTAATVRSARAASVGCRALVARYVGALNEANRRLVNDGKFYRDVQHGFGG